MNGATASRIVLLGGGHAHALTLLMWARSRLAGLEVVLVSPQPKAYYSGLVPAWLAGRIEPQAFTLDLAALCRAAGARLVIDEATGLDPEGRVLRLARTGALRYDLLSINTGSTLHAPAHDGPVLALRPLPRLLTEWPVRLAEWQAGQGPITLDLVGGGAAGVEVMLAALHRLRTLRPDRAIRPRLFCSSPRLLPGHNAGAVRRAELALQRAGVQLRAGRRWQPGDSAPGNWLLWAAGAEPPEWLRECGLQLSADGYVAVRPSLQSTSHASVFAAGDSAAFSPPLGKSGVRAVRMAPTLAHNLRAALFGHALQPHTPQRDTLALLALTAGRAIASRGRWLAAQGRAVGWWKDWLDHRFMHRFSPTSLPTP